MRAWGKRRKKNKNNSHLFESYKLDLHPSKWANWSRRTSWNPVVLISYKIWSPSQSKVYKFNKHSSETCSMPDTVLGALEDTKRGKEGWFPQGGHNLEGRTKSTLPPYTTQEGISSTGRIETKAQRREQPPLYCELTCVFFLYTSCPTLTCMNIFVLHILIRSTFFWHILCAKHCAQNFQLHHIS